MVEISLHLVLQVFNILLDFQCFRALTKLKWFILDLATLFLLNCIILFYVLLFLVFFKCYWAFLFYLLNFHGISLPVSDRWVIRLTKWYHRNGLEIEIVLNGWGQTVKSLLRSGWKISAAIQCRFSNFTILKTVRWNSSFAFL